MSAIENRRAVIVGIFIAVGLVILILGVFTLGNQQKSFSNGIHISAEFRDVSGLIKGNNVWFSGVKVGTIKQIRFASATQVLVDMNIDKNIQQFIHKNSGARISSEGLIGNKIVVIDGGSPNVPVIEDGDVLHADNMLSTEDIMKTLQQNNQNLLAITSDFKVLSKKILQGKGTVGALMSDSSMALKLRAAMNNLAATTASTARMAGELNRFSAKMNTKGGFADKLLTDTSTFRQIKTAATQLQQASASASTLAENLNKASNKLNSTDNALGVLLNDPKGGAQMQSTLNYLNQSSIKLNDDLEAAQHNFLLRGFFKKRDKEKQKAIADSAQIKK